MLHLPYIKLSASKKYCLPYFQIVSIEQVFDLHMSHNLYRISVTSSSQTNFLYRTRFIASLCKTFSIQQVLRLPYLYRLIGHDLRLPYITLSVSNKSHVFLIINSPYRTGVTPSLYQIVCIVQVFCLSYVCWSVSNKNSVFLISHHLYRTSVK